jgi:DNA-binding response OmpR family regulator
VIRLLLVEDDASNRMLFSALLEDDGFAVDTAASLADARAKIDAPSGEYALVLLDYHLGDGVGTDLLPALRERHPAARVVLLSGSAGDAGTAARVDATFAKGDDVEALMHLVHKLAGAVSGS